MNTKPHGTHRILLPVAMAASVIVAACGGGSVNNDSGNDAAVTNPDFGPNVTLITPSMTAAQINAAIAPKTGNPQWQIFFLPGTYGSAAGQNDPSSASNIINTTLNANTAIAGLGSSPDAVQINGALHVENSGNALGTFARTLSNLNINAIQPGLAAHNMNWITSQTAHWRRVDFQGNLNVTGNPSAFAFGNMIANSKISGTVTVGNGQNTAGGSGQQTNAMYYLRNSQIGGWSGFSSQMVFSGVTGAPADNFGPGDAARDNPGDIVNLAATPITREAPFIYVDANSHYMVFVPSAQTNTSGANWDITPSNGTSLSLAAFYIAQPTDSAATLNAQLTNGKNLLLTPGIYNLDVPLQVNRANAVVMGLGFAQVNAASGALAVTVGDVPGVVLSGFSVGTKGSATSSTLVQIGNAGATSGTASNPTALIDVHMAGNALTTEVINQNNVLVDGAWIRDGSSSSWTDPAGSYGIVVNGNNVTWTGLWVEHFKKTEITWNGNGGQIVFVENEAPYTPTSQALWMNGANDGYPHLKIADNVTSFKLDGFGAYTRFSNGCYCFASSAIETPVAAGVTFHGVTAGSIIFPVSTGGFTKGGYQHIFNSVGAAVDAGVASGTSKLPYSDTYGFTSNLRIADFPSQ